MDGAEDKETMQREEEEAAVDQDEGATKWTSLSFLKKDLYCFTPSYSPSPPTPASSPSSSSSSSPFPTLSPPLPESVDVSALLAGERLALDVYHGGARALPVLWARAEEEMKALRRLGLGSEDEEALGRAMDVLPKLSQLRSLTIKGRCFHDAQCEPLPGLLSALPPSLSALSHLAHLDLSFNRLSSLPPCLLSLRRLAELLLSYNQLSTLPEEVGVLSSLQRLVLMGNRIGSLPGAVGRLQALRTLDVSVNLLTTLPETLDQLTDLHTLDVSQNRLRELPPGLGSLPCLKELFLHSNVLRSVPESVTSPPLVTLDLRNNPIGQPPTPPPQQTPAAQEDPGVPELHLEAGEHSFSVTPDGCHVFLPGRAELLFPPGCVSSVTKLEWEVQPLQRKWVWLEDHDFLLSRPLELRPHGVSFKKPVEVCVPYNKVSRREVVLRRFDGERWSTLPTLTRKGKRSSRPGGRSTRLAYSSVSEFSWFVAVARLVSNNCLVPPEGALLVSSSDPGIKLSFPPEATTHTRAVAIQVLQVEAAELRQLAEDPLACASPLVHLSQSLNIPFLQPIRVQLPLPSGLTGHMLDRTRLRLLHRDSGSYTWNDVTLQVGLQITHLYATFSITHFSWYWLWYTTHRCVSGVVRKVYHRLRQFHVRFLAQQKRSDPAQVLLQCLPSKEVENRLQSLAILYDGPQPSEVCDLLEGEQFFAGFEGGIEIDADRPDCMEGRLSFIFYSHLKNLKEVFICTGSGKRVPVRGQVSFYRGDLPEELTGKRKGPDSKWMASLPIRLPGAGGEGSSVFGECPPLNLGDPESGYLTETNLLAISLRIGQDWDRIGMNLGISYQELKRMESNHRGAQGALVLEMLFHWARGQAGAGPGAVTRLMEALAKSERRDLAEEVEDIVSLGKRKYQESLKRVGLDAETPGPS
ncbi:p53-induced death domain-containing protein 1 [Denticeps clupeoides]|uniref:P53-induced death domain-containing protein 1 n=1 Tax=Denticeps clupeoides TaxID=299321 RepID=A0AAY4DWI3_9TELE|nr:p53-induced death domain-containing protein 1 [Denticeps clupeoides]